MGFRNEASSVPVVLFYLCGMPVIYSGDRIEENNEELFSMCKMFLHTFDMAIDLLTWECNSNEI
ncbi:unnamed protein product, partial [Schistosoma rodhaini]|uniref:Uncharacterized protein n=1 Tax=Schistosoma rodhaini TaxID=6188 RepID=A0AA85GIV3_9TREM